MARLNGPFQLTGSLGNLSFYYHSQYGYLVRQKGGGKGGKLSPRTRENSDEFVSASRASKLLRRGILAALHVKGDPKVSQRLNSCLSKVLQQDQASARGKRQVQLGLDRAEGRQLLSSFAFTEDVPLGSVLFLKPVYSAEEGVFTFHRFRAAHDLQWPAGATHVQLQCALIYADVAKDAYASLGTGPVVLGKSTEEQELRIAIEPDRRYGQLEIAAGTISADGFRGRWFCVGAVSVVFFQETGDELAGLKEGKTFGVL